MGVLCPIPKPINKRLFINPKIVIASGITTRQSVLLVSPFIFFLISFTILALGATASIVVDSLPTSKNSKIKRQGTTPRLYYCIKLYYSIYCRNIPFLSSTIIHLPQSSGFSIEQGFFIEYK